MGGCRLDFNDVLTIQWFVFQLLAELNRVGNNLNQIAKQLNSGGHPDPAALTTARAELMGLIEAILGALGRGS